MNQDKRPDQLPHIYHYLLSATATPGGQLFWKRQQWLPKRQSKQLKSCILKVKRGVQLFIRNRDTECHLPYEITQYYLPLVTSKSTPA